MEHLGLKRVKQHQMCVEVEWQQLMREATQYGRIGNDALVGINTGQRPESECESRGSLGLLWAWRDE